MRFFLLSLLLLPLAKPVAGVAIFNDAKERRVMIIAGAGGEAEYTFVLATRPEADVTLTPTSADLLEAIVSPVVFSSGNWSDPATVTVTGVNDNVDLPSDPTVQIGMI